MKRNYKTGFLELSVVLISTLLVNAASAQVFTVDTLMKNGNRNNRVNLVYLSDGYTAAQLNNYISNATGINNSLFAQSPFSEYKNFFNSFAVRVPSSESGAKHPGTASDESSSGGQPVANPNNYFGSTFDYFNIHRLLVPVNTSAIVSVLASNLPDYDQAFVVVNSPYYGGSGGFVATSSIHTDANEVAFHEIGHSFSNLADEYWAGDSYAAEKPNMTQNGNPATVKWVRWYGNNGIGIYPYGASGTAATWYRPHQNCKMQFLGVPFCSVCAERFVDQIHNLVNMIDDHLPSATSFTLSNKNNVDLSVTRLNTASSTISVNWYLNGSATPFETTSDNVSIPYSSFNIGNNTVTAEIIDATLLSRSYLPAAGYVERITWTISNPAVLPVRLLNFSGMVNDQSEGVLNWQVEEAGDLKKFELEKSEDGENFNTLAAMAKQQGRVAYSYTDGDLFIPATYYRLKVYDNDGSYFYSNVIMLRNAREKFSYKVYQLPEAHQYRLSCTLEKNTPVQIFITDASGRKVYQKNFGNVSTRLNEDIDLSKNASGIYFMNIQIGSGRYTAQLIAR